MTRAKKERRIVFGILAVVACLGGAVLLFWKARNAYILTLPFDYDFGFGFVLEEDDELRLHDVRARDFGGKFEDIRLLRSDQDVRPEDINIGYSLDNCLTTFIDDERNKVVNKYVGDDECRIAVDNVLGPSDNTAEPSEEQQEIGRQVARELAGIEHAGWRKIYFLASGKVLVVNILNVNWVSPIDFYFYENGNLGRAYGFILERDLGFSGGIIESV
ncbi:MAG: hypothetical protein LBM12_01940 [Candidatus Nomurabacteria bacterium]|jgi:hypothetical protein|nr:hypothetical protein [Candidatus Nomurabacteria bacterium]